MGSFVPAASAELGLVDSVYSRVCNNPPLRGSALVITLIIFCRLELRMIYRETVLLFSQ